MRFWDASAIVPLLVHQRSTAAMARLFETDPDMTVWWGTSVECASAVMRQVRQGNLTSDGLVTAERRLASLREEWYEIVPGEAVRTAAERMLRVHPLRASDALQLATAVIAADYTPRQMAMVCLDNRLTEAARKEGFDVLPTP